MKSFGTDIYEGKITIKEADDYQADQGVKRRNKKNKLFLITCINVLRVKKEFLTLLKAKYF